MAVLGSPNLIKIEWSWLFIQRVVSTHSCLWAMTLRFPIAAIRHLALSTHKSQFPPHLQMEAYFQKADYGC